METKICSKCKKQKSVYDFNKDKNTKDGYRCWCKQCQKEYLNKYTLEHRKERKEYLIKNKESLNAKSREYYEKHKSEINKKHRIYLKQYTQNNKEEIKKKKQMYRLAHKKERNEKEKQKRAKDKIYRLKTQIRNMINASFKRKYKNKNKKAETILGCSISYFINYLLQTYIDNYGIEWNGKELVHIDHIIPLAIANTEEDIIKLCHYTNLQLLKKQDNLKKRDKLNWGVANVE